MKGRVEGVFVQVLLWVAARGGKKRREKLQKRRLEADDWRSWWRLDACAPLHPEGSYMTARAAALPWFPPETAFSETQGPGSRSSSTSASSSSSS